MAYPVAFRAACERTLSNEGGYRADPNDPGDATNFGISQRSYPQLDIKTLTRDEAVDIYYRDWWLKYGFDQLPDIVAGKTFDLAIDDGAHEAIVCLQRACRACGSMENEDGILGPLTLGAVASSFRINASALMAALRSELAAYYRILLAQDPKRQEFIKGWLERSYS